MTVTGKTVGENIKDCVNNNPEVIRPIDNPYSQTGGLAVLKGNIAPDGGVVKRSAVVPEMMVHEGPARVFDCEEDAIAAIKGGKIVAGDVVVIRYEGPKGGPGMREMLNPTSAIAGMGLGSIGCSDHRRTFQWCIQRCFYRTCLTRSSCRRSDCPDRRRRYHQYQYSGTETGMSKFLMKRWQQEKQNGSRVNQRSQPDILQDMLQWLPQATEEQSLKCQKQNKRKAII